MISDAEKRTVMQAMRTATQRIIEEQDRICKDIQSRLNVPIKFTGSENIAPFAEQFLDLVADQPTNEHPCAPQEIERILDVDLRGSLTILNATLSHLEILKATKTFLEGATECN